MSFGIPVRNGLAIGLRASTTLSSGRGQYPAPAMVLNFLSGTLDSRVTFTRSTVATYVGSNGLLQTAAINAPRFDYDPVTLALKGLLIEEGRANLLVNSLINGTILSTQNVTVTAVPHTISFYGTGTVTLSGAAIATVVGTGAYPNRQTLTFTPTAGVLVCTVVGSVQYAQIEVGPFATSFIPTAAAPVARGADVVTMTGTNFSSWYNQTAGTFAVKFDTLWTGAQAATYGVLSFDSSATKRIVQIQATTTTVSTRDSATTIFTSNSITTGVNKAASCYSATDRGIVLNGSAVVTGAVDASYSNSTLLSIGIVSTGNYLNGHIRDITYYNTRLSNTQLQALTI